MIFDLHTLKIVQFGPQKKFNWKKEEAQLAIQFTPAFPSDLRTRK